MFTKSTLKAIVLILTRTESAASVIVMSGFYLKICINIPCKKVTVLYVNTHEVNNYPFFVEDLNPRELDLLRVLIFIFLENFE